MLQSGADPGLLSRVRRYDSAPSPSLSEKGGSTLKTREDKEQIVAGLKDRFERAKGAILAEYTGLTVEDITELRTSMKRANLEFKVVKNTLAKRAAADTSVEALVEGLKGQVALSLGYDDPIALAKSVMDYAKARENNFFVRKGIIEGKICDAMQLKAVASLPGREALLGQMAAAMQAPAQKLGSLLANTVNRLAFALHALKEQKAA